MTLAVMALYAEGTTTLTNIASWRVKKPTACRHGHRAALGATWRKARTTSASRRRPAARDWRAASIHTYDDHRVAMCFSLAAFNPAGLPVRIEDPKCVAKTFPDYFEALFSPSADAAHAGDLHRRPPRPGQRHGGGRGGRAAGLPLSTRARCTASRPGGGAAPASTSDAEKRSRHRQLAGSCRCASGQPVSGWATRT